MSKLIPYERKVYYYETDQMGIMHHSNYIRVFEEARIHYIAEAGMPFDVIEGMGLYMPTLEVDCKYKRPLTFNEKFIVEIRGEKFNGATLLLTYKVTNAVGDICAEGSSRHCFTDKNMRPVRIKRTFPDIYETFASHLEPAEK